MNTKPESKVQSSRLTRTQLGEVRMEGPHTIPTLWDVSTMLSIPAPSRNGGPAGRKGSILSVAHQEQVDITNKRIDRVLSELPDWEYPGFFFMPY
jgi:hypothetical protein